MVARIKPVRYSRSERARTAKKPVDERIFTPIVAPTSATAPAPVASAEPIAPPQPSAPPPAGSVDLMSRDNISGWAWNPQKPEESVVVEIVDGGQLLLRVRADTYREDLHAAGIGTGRYGFSVPNPAVLLPFARHQIAVRRALDGVDLPGSPQWVVRPEAGLDASTLNFFESAISANGSVARRAEELDHPLTLTLRVLNQILAARSVLTGHRPLSADANLQNLLQEAPVSAWMRELIVKLGADYAPLHFPAAAAPRVSIVIPVYEKFKTTYQCLESIAKHLPTCSFEIIVVDDASKDETMFAGFLFSGAVKIVRNSTNQGYVGSCNTGAAQARGEYLLFLNNDTLMRPRWLDELVATFTNAPHIGVVGAKLLFEEGTLQEAGGMIWRLGDGCNWGRHDDPAEPKYCYLRDCDYVSGAALMIERALFENLNGFDTHYSPAYYEDSDLCFRVRAAGKRVVVQPAAEIVHLEGVSSGTDVRGIGMKRYQIINQRKFYERWKDTLATHRYNGVAPELEIERTVKKRAYFIDDTVPTPDQDAGSNAATQHMFALMRLGYKVTFLPADNMAQINPYTANLQRLGIECLYAPYFNSVEEVFRKARVKPDLVYLHRYANASKYANLVRTYFPDSVVVYNVADLHFLRQQREAAVTGTLGGVAAVRQDAEIAAMRQVDSVLVHSSAEADLLAKQAVGVRVHTVPWAVQIKAHAKSFAERSGYAFIGGYGHRPNVDAVQHLARDIVPKLAKLDPGIVGSVVGSKAPPEFAALASKTLTIVGFAPDLSSVLHGLRCTVAPLRYGAGIKGKILESFAHGIPCVMSEVAAEGLALPRSMQWLIAGSAEEFAKKIATLHQDEARNARLASDGVEFIQTHFSERATEELLAKAIAR